MTVTESVEPGSGMHGAAPQLSLGTVAARKLSTVTKSTPQMRGISPRWLLRMLPWVRTSAGVYRVNRRPSHVVGDGQLAFVTTGAAAWVIAGAAHGHRRIAGALGAWLGGSSGWHSTSVRYNVTDHR